MEEWKYIQTKEEDLFVHAIHTHHDLPHAQIHD